MTTQTQEAFGTTTPSDILSTPAPHAAAEVFAERLTAAALGSMEMAAVHVGTSLGWYRALADHGPLSPTELGRLTGTAERYAREWLEHQAASGYLDAADHVDGRIRRYRLHPGAAEALVDVDSPLHVAPLSGFLAAAGRVTDQLLDAYRTGGGVSWEELGADARLAQAAVNRPLFLHQLSQEIVPELPELADRLRSGARVADIGCGEGWSAIGLAQGFSGVTVDGYDIDAASIVAAARHAAGSDVAERVRFAHVDAATLDPDATGRYDVVTAFECVHDMPDPVAVLTAMRRVAAPGAYVLVMDERTEDVFTAPAGPVERLLYGFSLLCCLPDGLSHPDGVGTGTVMRPSTLAAYATDAGFTSVEVLAIEHEMFRFYRLHL
jgi:2-polyprenyl-3-methyl-5-hydroxy-6-metoxy-1,4-benzoquinol methylase